MFGFGKKKKFLAQNVRFLHSLIGVTERDAEKFFLSLTYFDLQYEFSKSLGEPTQDDLLNVAQSSADMIYDLSLSRPYALPGILKSGHMDEVWIMAYAAKIGAVLLSRNIFKGSASEQEVFQTKFTEFCKIMVNNLSGEEVSLLSFISDPIGNHRSLQEIKKALKEPDNPL